MADTAAASQAVVAVGEAKRSLPAPQLNVVDTQTRAIGVIVPPQHVRQVVDKTAEFVAKNGTDFEQKILAGPKNVKFNFINVTDPYHKYYQYKILEAKEGTEAAQAAFADDGAAALAAKGAPAAAAAAAAVEEEEPEKPPLVKPDDEKYTVHIPPGLTLQELDIIKLTAQYVARNGAEFLRGLRSREETKREFMFLKETHSLNTFFKRLTDAYSSVLLDSKEALQRLHVDAADSSAALTRCLQRLAWVKERESEADEAKAERERERLAMMLVDWHDFAVVRTIDFDDSEDVYALGKPVTKQMVIQMNKAADAREEAAPADEPMAGADDSGAGRIADAGGADAEEAALIAAGQTNGIAPIAAPTSAPPAAPAMPESTAGSVMVADDDDEAPIKVVRDYKRTPAGQEYDPTEYVVSPLTGELVRHGEMQEHMRIGLIDPKWKEQREAMLAKIKETNKASDPEIMSNLTRLAGTRPDVFGSDVSKLSQALALPDPKSLPRDGPSAVGRGRAGGPPVLAPLPAVPAGVALAAPPQLPTSGARPVGMPPPPAAMPPPPMPPPAAAQPQLPAGLPPPASGQPAQAEAGSGAPGGMPPPPGPPPLRPPPESPDPKRQKTG